MEAENDFKSNTSKRESLLDLLKRGDGITEPLESVADYINAVGKISEHWQEVDRKEISSDEEYTLNATCIVGQVWFRGHGNCDLSLQPELYREATWKPLLRDANYLTAEHTAEQEEQLFDDLFDLEHEMRIDFTNYGHLLNEANQAKTPIDWYFLMQHHAVPTRLLDWSTNALAALFFAVDEYRKQAEARSGQTTGAGAAAEGHVADQTCVAVWMIDAYWLAGRLSDDWRAPLLPYSEDAAQYVPPLKNLIEQRRDAQTLVPKYPMPIEPPAMHPRVAAQEGRFIIFGRNRELLDQKIKLERDSNCEEEEIRVRQIKFRVSDHHAVLRQLAQLGVSRRTLFPDLAGLANFVRWKHTHTVQSGHNPVNPATVRANPDS